MYMHNCLLNENKIVLKKLGEKTWFTKKPFGTPSWVH